MKSLSEIITLPKLKTPKSERAELIKYFVDNLKQKNGKPYPARSIAVKLSHLKKEDLYYFQSECRDIMNRRGQEAFQKFFWWSLK